MYSMSLNIFAYIVIYRFATSCTACDCIPSTKRDDHTMHLQKTVDMIITYISIQLWPGPNGETGVPQGWIKKFPTSDDKK